MDSVSDDALRCGAEIVVHAYRDGRAPGLERVRSLGVEPVVFPATGTSEDVAMLLADDKGAALIVAVGTHATLVEFLDKGRSGHGQHLPHPAAGRRQAGRRQGRQPALPGPHLQPVSLVLMLLVGLLALVAALWSHRRRSRPAAGARRPHRTTCGRPSQGVFA